MKEKKLDMSLFEGRKSPASFEEVSVSLEPEIKLIWRLPGELIWQS